MGERSVRRERYERNGQGKKRRREREERRRGKGGII